MTIVSVTAQTVLPAGPQGPQGIQGVQGLQGNTGPQGVQGVQGAGYSATSATSRTVALGTHVLTTQSGLAYSPGAFVKVSSASAPSKVLQGPVTGYAGTTLTINATKISGSGSASDWNINLAGEDGPTGAAGANGTLDPTYVPGYLGGLKLSNNAGDANNRIDIAVGSTVDETSVAFMQLASILTKRLDVAWAVGSANGGLDSGSKANSTWYHVFLIKRSDTGVVDAMFSTSLAPTLPTNYDRRRRIGSIRTNSSGNILAFKQIGDDFLWVDGSQDANNLAVNGTQLLTLRVPSGLQVPARGRFYFASTPGSILVLNSPDQTDDGVTSLGYSQHSGANDSRSSAFHNIRTNASSQIRVASSAAIALYVFTEGWTDRRGRDG